MNILRDKNIALPELYPIMDRKLPTIADAGYTKIGGFTLRKDIDICGQEGIQEQIIASDCNLIFATGGATLGKGQILTDLISTPYGWKMFGDLKVGDIITGSDGKPQKVDAIYDRGVMDMYEIETHDGGKMSLSLDHLCIVNERKPHKKSITKVLEFRDIKKALDGENDLKYSIPIINGEVEYEPLIEKLPIEPYVMGNLLGNGCFTNKVGFVSLSTMDDFILDYVSDYFNAPIVRPINKCSFVRIKRIEDILISLNLYRKLSLDKFIPKIYLHASIEDRRELLKGLMDSDGSINNLGGLEYSTSSKQLALDFQELVRSLGGICPIKQRIPKYTYKGESLEGQISYRCYPAFNDTWDMFKTPRKVERANQKKRKPDKNSFNRRIISYKYIGKHECRCIRVSNPDHLYVTRDFILTHNTFAGFLKALQGVGRPNYSARLVSGALQDFKSESSLVRDMKVVYNDFANCKFTIGDYPTAYWEEWNNTIKGMHMNFNTSNPKEWYDCMEYLKSNQASYFYWDELTKVRDERVLLYSLSRNRDNSGLRPCTVCTFNPKKNHFSYNMLLDAGYIDTSYDPPIIRQGISGVVKYFFVKGNYVKDIVWGDTREDVLRRCNIKLSIEDIEAGLTPEMMIKSFTCLTGEASQNRILLHATHGESVANLLNTGAKYAKSLKEGAFVDDDEDEESQTVTKKMIDTIFDNPQDDGDVYYASLDVGGGGKGDPSFMWIWRGTTLIEFDYYNGNPKEVEGWIRNILNTYNVPMERFSFDACGLGHYLTAYTNGRSIKSNVRPVPEIDEAGNENTMDLCFNLRSQLLNKIKGMVATGKLACALDRYTMINYYGKDRYLIDILYDEVNIFMETKRNKKIYYKSKDEYKQKYGSSPNIMDALTYGAIFFINAKERKEVEPVYEEADYCDLYGCIGDEYKEDYEYEN